MITVLRLAEHLMSANYRQMLLLRLTPSSDQLLMHPSPKTTPSFSSLFESQHEKARCLESGSAVDMMYRPTEPNQSCSSNVYKLQYPYQDASFSSMSHHLEGSIPVCQVASSRREICETKIQRDNLQNSATPLFIQGNSTASSPSEGLTSNQEELIDEHEIVQEVLQKLKATKASLDRISGESQLEELWQQERRTAGQSISESLQYQPIPPVTPSPQLVCNQAEQTSSIPPLTSTALVCNSKGQTSSESVHSESQHQLLVTPNPNDLTISTSPPIAGAELPQINVLATSSPDQQGRVQQGRTFNGVMQRFNFMAAQPLNMSASRQPLWSQALNAQQRVTCGHQPQTPTTPPTPSTTPTPVQPMWPSSPIHVNKKRQMTDSKAPPEINAKNQKKESLRSAISRRSTTAAVPSPALSADELPPESSFIPVLLENELEDVLNQGYPVCLGNGAYGEVYLKRKIGDGTLVAVKRLKGVHDHMKAYQEMVTEIRTMMAVQHLTEFIRVLGIIDQQSFGVEFVGDPVSMTSTHLHSVLTNPPANLETMDWIQICLDLSRGLLALHNAGWSHNDLHSCNVIIWRDVCRCHKWSAKIIDLGLATRLNPPPPVLIYDKSWCYDNCPQMPPEVIEGVCHHSIITDIYSLGHLFSIITANKAELAFINDIGENCLGLSQCRPSLQSIIQDVERFKSETMKKIARNNTARGQAATNP